MRVKMQDQEKMAGYSFPRFVHGCVPRLQLWRNGVEREVEVDFFYKNLE